LTPTDYLIGSVAALVVSSIAGVAGYGAGILMPFVLVPLLGPQPVVPILAVTALFNNAGRLLAFRGDIDWRRALQLAAVAVPFCLLGSSAYTFLSGRGALLAIGTALILVVPARRLLRGRAIGTSWKHTVVAGAVYGFLIGGAPGVGVVLIPILLGMGVRGRSVIVTDSFVSLIVGCAKVATFQAAGIMSASLWAFAVVIGLCGIPGAYVAKFLADRMSLSFQEGIMDAGVLVGGGVLVVRALQM
jgi:uncharacterized protein